MDTSHKMSVKSSAYMFDVFVLLCALCFARCGTKDIKAVDIYPEDMCTLCRMAVSDERFACELLVDHGEVLKFDDIGCMEQYLRTKPETRTVVETFYKDYERKGWIAAARATVVETDVMTPMGSGKVAFADSEAAAKFQREHVASGGN